MPNVIQSQRWNKFGTAAGGGGTAWALPEARVGFFESGLASVGLAMDSFGSVEPEPGLGAAGSEDGFGSGPALGDVEPGPGLGEFWPPGFGEELLMKLED